VSLRRATIVLAALASLLLPAPRAGAVTPPVPETLTLRLVDLGPGYTLGDLPGCGVVAGEGAAPALTQLYLKHRHRECNSTFLERWTPPGSGPRPRSILSAAFRFGDVAGPSAELNVRDVIAYVVGLQPTSLVPGPAPAIGDESVAFKTGVAPVPGEPDQPGAVVAWRSGRMLALVMAAGRHADVVAEATRLANVQQQRIERPTPLLATDNDDIEVLLDDPGLETPVLWLGRVLRPGGRLPAPTLALAETDETPSEIGDLRLEYERAKPPFAGVSLYVWQRSRWRRFSKDPFARLGWHERCVRSTRVPVKGGVAVIYAGHEQRQARCGRPPDRFLAHVFLRDVMVSVNPVICIRCRRLGISDDSSYDSMEGMRAIVHALQVRNPRSTPPAP
jgi:hypothetical protein